MFPSGDPEFISGIRNVSVAVGRDASLSCHISNNQVKRLRFLKIKCYHKGTAVVFYSDC